MAMQALGDTGALCRDELFGVHRFGLGVYARRTCLKTTAAGHGRAQSAISETNASAHARPISSSPRPTLVSGWDREQIFILDFKIRLPKIF